MMVHTRIFILVVGLLFLLASDSTAAGKRKHAKRGKPAQSKPAGAVLKSTPGGLSESTKKENGSPDVRATETRAASRESARQESRIEFDERMLKGQSASGVIYLFQRTPSDWKSIVQVPDSFRRRTVEPLTPIEERK
jgi:hypothetical protein